MKKIVKILIIALVIFVGYLFLKSDIFYKPDYQRVSQVLHYPQKEISFEVDVNKWDIKQLFDDELYQLDTYEFSGLKLFYGDIDYSLKFAYTHDSTRQERCLDGNTGDSCSVELPASKPHPDSHIIDVDGYQLAIPVYLTEEENLSYPWVAQLLPKYDNAMTDRMNFLNNPQGVSDYNQYFIIDPDNPHDEELWKKEIEPALIHALETFEIKDLKEKTK